MSSTLAFTIRNDSSILFDVTPRNGPTFQVYPQNTSPSLTTDDSYLVARDQNSSAKQFSITIATNNLKITKSTSMEGATITVMISGATLPPTGPSVPRASTPKYSLGFVPADDSLDFGPVVYTKSQ